MVTIVQHEAISLRPHESYFYIDDNNELCNIPECNIDSKVLNLTNKNLWVLKCCANNSKKWRRYGSSEEVPCGWITN